MLSFFYEIKKVFIHQKGILTMVIFILLKMMSMLWIEHSVDTQLENHKEAYSYYINQVNGKLTDQIEVYIKAEEENISSAHKALNTIYRNYYEGKIDYDELVIIAEEYQSKIAFEVGYQLLYEQYMYIRENPNTRYFLYTNGWSALLAHERLDVLLFLVLLIMITPIFCQEYENKMHTILITSKEGKTKVGIQKMVLAMGICIFLTLIFILLDYVFIQMKYGLPNGGFPIQSLEYYHNAHKNVSFSQAFTYVVLYRLLGYLSLTSIILLLSVYTQKIILTLFISTSLILLPYFGLSIESTKYYIPIPLGFMIGNGFFRGDTYIENVVTMQKQTIFKSISVQETLWVSLVLTGISFIMIILTIKRYENKSRWPL
jgi:hypothetical protein